MSAADVPREFRVPTTLPPADDPHVGSPQAVEPRAGEGRTPATSPAGGHEIISQTMTTTTNNEGTN